MINEHHKRSIAALLIGILVVVVIYLLVPSQPMVPRGILLPLSTRSDAPISPDQVAFYNPEMLSNHFEKIGFINVQYASEEPTPEQEAILANYVKQLAAGAGANGVVINLLGHTVKGEVPSPQASYVFRGVAIQNSNGGKTHDY